MGAKDSTKSNEKQVDAGKQETLIPGVITINSPSDINNMRPIIRSSLDNLRVESKKKLYEFINQGAFIPQVPAVSSSSGTDKYTNPFLFTDKTFEGGNYPVANYGIPLGSEQQQVSTAATSQTAQNNDGKNGDKKAAGVTPSDTASHLKNPADSAVSIVATADVSKANPAPAAPAAKKTDTSETKAATDKPAVTNGKLTPNQKPEDEKVIKTASGGYMNIPENAKVETFGADNTTTAKNKVKVKVDKDAARSFTVDGKRYIAGFDETSGAFLGYVLDTDMITLFKPTPILYEDKVNADFKNKFLQVTYDLGMDPNKLMAMMKVESGFNPKAENWQKNKEKKKTDKKDADKKDAGKTDASKKDAPKTDASKKDTLKKDTPKTDAKKQVTTVEQDKTKKDKKADDKKKDDTKKKDPNEDKHLVAVGLIQFTKVALDQINQENKTNYTLESVAAMSASEQLDLVEKYYKTKPEKKLKLKTMEDYALANFNPAYVGDDPSTVIYSSPSSGYKQNKGMDREGGADGKGDGKITVKEATSNYVDAYMQKTPPARKSSKKAAKKSTKKTAKTTKATKKTTKSTKKK